MTIEDGPAPFNRTEYMKTYMGAYRKTDKAKAIKRATRKSITDAKYLSKRIVAVDGEGINIRRGLRKGDHLYILLAISDAPPLSNRDGLSTREILDYLWRYLNPADINVIYGGSYDFNLWVRDLLEDQVRALYNSSYSSAPVHYQEYGLRWIKGKAFEISRKDARGKMRTITVNDVISFFQRPFIQACDEYLGNYEGRETLVREKARRGNFNASELEGITDYNNLELDLLVRLVSELRTRLNRVKLRPRRWNSPGAIASALFTRERIKQHRNEAIPEPVARAARFAYAGGRFELLKYGSVKERVYEYDINSAYPRALCEVPSLMGGVWQHAGRVTTISDYGLYRVRFTGSNPNIPAPIFVRGENGTISYPLQAENWVWSPEARVLQEYCEQIPGTTYEILEAWEYTPRSNVKPFHFIWELYKKRQELKAKGDGAHVGIKLALNSVYGKLAQQVGWKPATKQFPVRVPTYHQLEWAGYVTSWCRAHVLRAALTDIDSVIAFETDALFTTRRLRVEIGGGLGEWEETIFSSLTYVQSGHYYGTAWNEKKQAWEEVIKCRGIDKGFISRKRVESLLTAREKDRILPAALTRFYGVGIALARGLSAYWCKWLTEEKAMTLTPTGKRLHGECWCGDTRTELVLGKWHSTYCPVVGGESHEYPVEWINPNPDMTELSEFRESENFYED